MIRHWIVFAVMVAAIAVTGSQRAWSAPLAVDGDSTFYYKIGGAHAITAAPNPNVLSQKLGGSAELGFGYSCGKFDHTLGVTNLLNSLSSAGDNLINGAVGAVTAAIGSLPALILQRVNPGLYDLFQNALIRVEGILALSAKSCEQMEREIAQGKNPFEDWITLSKGYDWKTQMGNGGAGSSTVDVKTAQDTVEAANGANGVPWVGGARAGGEGNQPPIRVTYDVTHAGYNITLNRDVGSAAPAKATAPDSVPRLVEVWADPDTAATWATEVLGDALVHTHDNRSVESLPGHGLLPKIEAARQLVLTDLTALVEGAETATLTKLEAVSSDAILITREVIEAIQELDPSGRAVAVEKLASEVAMARVLEQAMLMRRLLLAGQREPNVALSPAAREVSDLVTVLDREIDNLLFETRVRKELVANTAQVLTEIEDQRRNRATRGRPNGPQDERLIEDGASE